MLLFKPEHVQPIIQDVKIATRRTWSKCRVRIGSVHQAKTKIFSKDCFALLKISGIERQALGLMTEQDAQDEGGYTLEGYKKEWERVYEKHWNPDEVVFVVKFRRLPPTVINSEVNSSHGS